MGQNCDTELNIYRYNHQIFDKGIDNVKWNKRKPFQLVVQGNQGTHHQKKK